MDTMIEGEKTVKDTDLSIKDTPLALSYNKANKLVIALYMVTDIIPEAEPLRSKLRSLGAELISDINTLKFAMSKTALERAVAGGTSALGLLEVAFTMGMISEMNWDILKREFSALLKALEAAPRRPSGRGFALSELLLSEETGDIPPSAPPARIGVQRGGNLMKALSDKVSFMSKDAQTPETKSSADMSRKERRFEIVKVLKDKMKDPKFKGLTISDIRNMSDSIVLRSTSEKTIQRELVSMVADSVLSKEGSKRWSRYFLKVNI